MHDHLVGIEVFNKADKYPTDRKLWDNLLTHFMPERPIWAFGNDDNHINNPGIDFAVSWNVFLLDSFELESVKDAYKAGEFFACNKTSKDAPSPPEVKSINVNKGNSMIEIEAENYDEIYWISEGEKVADGKTVDISNLNTNHTRR